MQSDKAVPHLRVERFIDPQTGEATVHYLWKDRLVSKVKLAGRAAEQASGLTLIQKDLANARRWIEQAQQLIGDDFAHRPADTQYVHAQDRARFDTAKALFVASLAFYAKAFTEANGRKAQMQRDWLDEPFREPHDYYMNLRHNFAAHSGDLQVEYAESYVLLVPVSRHAMDLRFATNRVQPDFVQTFGEEQPYVALVDHALAKISERYSLAAERLAAAAASKSLAFWAAASSGSEAINMDPIVAASKKKPIGHK